MSEQLRECTCESEFAHEPWCMLHDPPPKATEPNSYLVEIMRLCKRITTLEAALERQNAVMKSALEEVARNCDCMELCSCTDRMEKVARAALSELNNGTKESDK